MNAHFDILAPFYDRVIPTPDPARLQQLLGLPTEGWLLDAGGGTGRASLNLVHLVGRLVVSDLSVPMLDQARSKGMACPVQAQAERLPFADGHFDRVLVVDALHHFSHQRDALAELWRVLKPGGRLVIEEPDIAHFHVKLIALVEKLTLMNSHFYAPAVIQAMLTALGGQSHIERDGQFTAWVVVDKVPMGESVNG